MLKASNLEFEEPMNVVLQEIRRSLGCFPRRVSINVWCFQHRRALSRSCRCKWEFVNIRTEALEIRWLRRKKLRLETEFSLERVSASLSVRGPEPISVEFLEVFSLTAHQWHIRVFEQCIHSKSLRCTEQIFYRWAYVLGERHGRIAFASVWIDERERENTFVWRQQSIFLFHYWLTTRQMQSTNRFSFYSFLH